MTRERSTAFDFMAAVVITLVIGQLVLAVWFLIYEKESYRKARETSSEMEAKFLAEYSAAYIKGGDRSNLDSFVSTLRADGDVLSIQIRRSDGLVMLNERLAEELETNSLAPFYIPVRNSVHAPIRSGGTVTGEVDLEYSGASVNGQIKALMTTLPLLQGIVFLLAAIVIYVLFRVQISRPLRQLGSDIARINDGDLTVTIPQDYALEIAVVAKGMQTLVDRFSYAVSRLDTASDKVSRTSRKVLASTRVLAESAQRQNETTEAMAMILKGASETHRQLISITEDVAALSSENVSSLLEVKAMGDEIVTGMETLFRATEISLSNVAQMTQTSKTMAAGSGEALERVESISASVEEVTASVKEVERNARSSAELAEAVRSSAAKEGVEVVAVAIEGMGRISNVVSITVDQVKRLHDSSLDIQRILSVIREITEQTNLLSLNASILAEKAGEHGKGFSVVAEEMRSLSGRTASYTREISGIIKSILGGIEDTVDMINASAKMVGAESDKVYNVGETVSGILEAAHDSASMAQSIEHATVEQARALQLVANSMLDVHLMAMQMKKAMDEQMTATSQVLEQVGEVREIADSTKRGVNEQDTGIRDIAKNMESANEMVSNVKSSILTQQRITEEIGISLSDMHSTGLGSIKDIESLTETLENLQRDIAQIRAEMGSLRGRP